MTRTAVQPHHVPRAAGVWLGDRFVAAARLRDRAAALAAGLPGTGVARGSRIVMLARSSTLPRELPMAASLHPAVDDCVVFGVPDDEFGQRVVAAVTLRPGVGITALEEFRPFLRAVLTSYKVPRGFVAVDRVSRDDSGKPRRGRAREDYLKGRAEWPVTTP